MKNYLSKTKKMLMLASCLALFVFVACNDNNNDPPPVSGHYYRIGDVDDFIRITGMIKPNGVLVYTNLLKFGDVFDKPRFYDDLSELENCIDSLSKHIIADIADTFPPIFYPPDAYYEFVSEYQYYKICTSTGEEEVVVARQKIEVE